MAKLIATNDIVMIDGREVNLRSLNQKQLKKIQRIIPKFIVNEIPSSEPSESNIALDASGGA